MDEETPAESGMGPARDEWANMARKGLLLLTLIVLAAAVALAFLAVNDVIGTWLEARWAPVWRAVFAVVVAVLAWRVLVLLTGRRLL